MDCPQHEEPGMPSAAKRAGDRRRARQALGWCLGVFLITQLGLTLTIEKWLPEWRDPLYSVKARRLAQRNTPAPSPFTVVMLGSSRTVYGFNAGLLEGTLGETTGRSAVVFNFGVTGAGPVTTLLNLSRLLAQGIRPDLVLIEVLPPLLTRQPELAESRHLPADRLWWRDLPLIERYFGTGPKLWEDWWLTEAVPAYAHRFSILSCLIPAYLPLRLRQDWFLHVNGSGWVDSPSSLVAPGRRPDAIERTRLEYFPYLKDFQLGGAPCAALREQLELCRQEGIAVALVLMPEGSDFRSWYSATARDQIEGFLGDLQRVYDVPLIDARSWIADEEFSDSHHLLRAGATEFTERLGREVQLLRPSEPEALATDRSVRR
jgi:hypothetical protein